MTSLENDPLFYKNFSEELLKKRGGEDKQNKIVFFSVAGSHSFNLNVETSDSDYFGVYCSNIDRVLSGNNKSQTLDCHDPDYVMFEAEKFCELLYKGNPKLIEPLFSDNYCYQSNDWISLGKDRKKFISLSVIKHYISYAKIQLFDAIKAKEQSEQQQSIENVLKNLSLSSNHSHHKKLYHTLRILLETNRMIQGGEPLVYLTGPEREKIMDIRLGKSNVEHVLEEISNLFESCQKGIDRLRDSNSIQETCSVKLLSDWLVQLRVNSFIESESIKESIKFNLSTDFVLNIDGDDADQQWKKELISKFKQLMIDSGVQDGHLLMIKSSGSHLHGLNNDNKNSNSSINDWIGVYVSDTKKYLSLYTQPSRIDSINSKTIIKKSKIEINGNEPKSESTSVTYVNGIQLFEVGLFLTMLEQGNHRAIECLESKESIESVAWKELISRDINYSSLNLIVHYWGVAQGNIGKAKDTKLPLIQRQKLLYHALRLILNSKNLLESKKLLELNEQDKEKLLLLKSSDEIDIEQFNQLYNETKEIITVVGNQLSKRDDNSSKQKKQNEQNLKSSHNDWLIKLRKSLL
ncbi:hypothetical protein CYY_004867 [Polysphondylium violaceum]|uniref:Nucleotidyltransferase n=1 Tax=Polysphondylium violaceum TaxID=133409 RepID=A0A8J4PXE6_9MYCE|nr:hypothetical protein CYY_004867 [Polysphondylium violaceum]